jgi:HMG (high mobility group) box
LAVVSSFLVFFVSSFMSQATSYTSNEVTVPLSFHMPVRFATPVILPLPQSPSTFKHEDHWASPARNIEAIVAGSSRLPTPDRTYSTALAAASHQHTIAEDHPYMTGRELRRGACPYSTPTNDMQPAPEPEPQTKKSHSRKQPEGHIPRPRNAFILFRCDFVAQKKIPASVEPDHRNISRIVGRIWKAMSDEDRRPWVEEAKKEREAHKRLYPQYRYSPTSASAAAATTALKEKRAQNQKIRESMGVLPAWELTSHTRNALQSWTHLAKELGPGATHGGLTLSPTRTIAPDASWSGPTGTVQICGDNVAPHAPSRELSPPSTVGWEQPSQSQQSWSFATSSTDPPNQHCPLQVRHFYAT